MRDAAGTPPCAACCSPPPPCWAPRRIAETAQKRDTAALAGVLESAFFSEVDFGSAFDTSKPAIDILSYARRLPAEDGSGGDGFAAVVREPSGDRHEARSGRSGPAAGIMA